MGFLNPAMLIGLAALAIPIIVHLLNRRRFKKVEWAAMRFLQVSLERNQRRMKVEDWLLLLMRLAIVALIALALARPATNWLRSQFLGSKIATALVIDHSGSMERKDAGAAGSRFERAKAAAGEAVEALPRGSAAAIILAADTPGEGITEPTHDLERAKKFLEEASNSHRGSDLSAGVDAALSTLEGHAAGTRELVLITDGEATAWRQFESIVRRLESAGEDLRTVIALVGSKPGENLAVTRLAQSTPVAAVGQPLRLSVEVTNFGIADTDDLPVQLSIDGEPVGDPVEIENLPAGEARTVTLFAKVATPGFHQITASLTGEDALPSDNSRTVVVRAIEKERALLVDGQPGRDSTGAETFFLQNALVPVPPEMAAGFFLAADRVSIAEFPDADLAEYRVVFLANVAEFTAISADRLLEFVRGGGGLVVFPGDNINRSFYNTELVDKRGLLPAAYGEIIEGDLHLQPSGYDHPLVALWNDPGAGTLADATIRKAYELTGVETSEGASVVLRYDSGQPAVVEAAVGLGVVYQFNTTADTDWNDLPVRPAFLPIVHRLFGSVLARADAGLNLQVGDTFSRRGGSELAGRKATVYAADSEGQGSAVEIVASGDGSVVSYDRVHRAGVYELSIPDPPTSLIFAAAPDPRESDPELLSPAQLSRLREVAEVIELGEGGSLNEALGRERSGAELWPLLLLAAGILAIIEMFLAQRFSQEK